MSGVKTYDWPKKLRLGPPVKSQNDNHVVEVVIKKFTLWLKIEFVNIKWIS